ncbi:MAG: aminotransferase class IV, partial [Proteobacteria bacterium]|nr:aminotransferase class IV [Pseudomonadota bacterium]
RAAADPPPFPQPHRRPLLFNAKYPLTRKNSPPIVRPIESNILSRERYEKAMASCPDADDVLLYNETGEVTESCIANVVIFRNGRRVTPPIRCGLLNGAYRAELLENGEISEETVSLSELKKNLSDQFRPQMAGGLSARGRPDLMCKQL